jgi:hypothetical protein
MPTKLDTNRDEDILKNDGNFPNESWQGRRRALRAQSESSV